MNDQERIALFLATRGATRIEPNAKTTTSREMRELVRGEHLTIPAISVAYVSRNTQEEQRA